MRALVTGGGGFLGSRIVRKLLARNITVRTFSRGDYPFLSSWGAEALRGDLTDQAAVKAAVAGCDVIFHVAAKAGVWGSYDDYYNCNVLGSRYLLDAALNARIRRFIYTSSPSVVFDGTDQADVSEAIGYPERYAAHYPKTKALAEKAILAVNGNSLATIALRPHLIWGPGDPHLIPRITSQARRGRLSFIGSGNNLVDAVFVDNAADAHLCALDRLDIGSISAGKSYFITNHEPWPIARLVNAILAAASLAPVTRHIPKPIAYAAATVMEYAYKLLPTAKEPPLTRFTVQQLSCAHWYNNSRAKAELGYCPEISMAKGMAILESSFTN